MPRPPSWWRLLPSWWRLRRRYRLILMLSGALLRLFAVIRRVGATSLNYVLWTDGMAMSDRILTRTKEEGAARRIAWKRKNEVE